MYVRRPQSQRVGTKWGRLGEYATTVKERYFIILQSHFPDQLSILFQVVAPINKMIDTVPFNVLTYSLDWPPSDHLSFDDNVTLRKLHESSPVGDPKISLCFINTISIGHQNKQEERIYELNLNLVFYRHLYVSHTYKATVRSSAILKAHLWLLSSPSISGGRHCVVPSRSEGRHAIPDSISVNDVTLYKGPLRTPSLRHYMALNLNLWDRQLNRKLLVVTSRGKFQWGKQSLFNPIAWPQYDKKTSNKFSNRWPTW